MKKRRKIKMTPIKDTPKLKEIVDNGYYAPAGVPGGNPILLANGILGYLKFNKISCEWLQATSDIDLYDSILKVKYGERHLNSWGQMMMWGKTGNPLNDQLGFLNGCDMIYALHKEEWDRLWTSYIAEYNPIWNVDGTETTTETRNLEAKHTGTDTIGQTGTIALGRTGNNSDVNTGFDNLEHNGSNTDTTTGAYSDSKSGFDKVEHDGTDKLAKAGSETNAHNGYIKDTGTETVAKSIYGFNSNSDTPSDKEVRTPNLSKQFDNETNTLSFTNREDTETVDLDDTTTYNSASTRQYDSNNPLTETHGFNSSDKQNYNSTTTHNFASTDTQTFAKTDTDTKNLTDTDKGTVTTVNERQGNIGITMTQQLLQADQDYWLSKLALFYENVLRDIVNDICYKIQVDDYI